MIKEESNLTLSLIGKYWVGKWTYSKGIADMLWLSILSIRQVLHQDHIIKNNYVANNVLIPDNEVFRVLSQYDLCWKLIDWFPRTKNQAQYLMENTRRLIVLVLDIDDKIIDERIINRISCPICNRSYNSKLWYQKEWDNCVDINCNWILIRRLEDLEENYAKRKQSFLIDTLPAIEYISNKNWSLLITLPDKNVIETEEYIIDYLKNNLSTIK